MLTRPELKGQAVVLHETQRGTERVVACSARAVALGVTVGMSLAEATALAGQGEREKGEGGRRKAEGGRRKAACGLAAIQGSGFRVQDSCINVFLGPTTTLRILPPSAFRLPPFPPRPSPLAPHPSPLAPQPSDPLADRRALEALAEWSAQFSPIVGLENSTAPESLLLDVTGLVHLFGGEASLAEKILGDFTRRGLTIRIAVADTIGAAWALAHSQSSIINHQSSIIILPPGGTLAALWSLPLAALRLPTETVELLRQLGVDRIGQLEALPRDELSSRFGPELLRRWDQAIGRLAEPVPMHGQPPQFEADCSLEHPTTRRETIEAVLEKLIGQLAQMLLDLGRGAMRLECRLDCISAGPARAEPVQLSVGLFRPTAAAGHLCSLVQMQLERLRLPGPLSGMHVAVAATAPLLEEQQELFSLGDGLSRRHDRYLAELVERLSSRLGRGSVLRVRLVADAQPELAWRYDPLVEDSRRRAARRPRATAVSAVLNEPSTEKARLAQPWHSLGGRGRAERAPGSPVAGGPLRGTPATLPPRPLRLLRRPVALRVTSLIPGGLSQFSHSENGTVPFPDDGIRSENGTVPFPDDEVVPLRLLSFQFGGRDHRIAQHWGPERIETGWWRNRTVGRDYYHVETTTGHRYWLFRRLRDGRWFLHGMFE